MQSRSRPGLDGLGKDGNAQTGDQVVRNMLSYYLWLPYYMAAILLLMAAVLLLMAAILWQLYYYALYMVFRSPVGFCGWSVAI